jgi:hypothetical protein
MLRFSRNPPQELLVPAPIHSLHPRPREAQAEPDRASGPRRGARPGRAGAPNYRVEPARAGCAQTAADPGHLFLSSHARARRLHDVRAEARRRPAPPQLPGRPQPPGLRTNMTHVPSTLDGNRSETRQMSWVGKDSATALTMLLLDPRTSIYNNVRRVGSSSPPRRHFRTGLLLGRARDSARSFVGRFQNRSVLGGRYSASTDLGGMVDPDWSGAVSFGRSAWLNPWKEDGSARLARDKK